MNRILVGQNHWVARTGILFLGLSTLGACATTNGSSYTASVLSAFPLSSATLGVEISVTNNGTSSGTPSCSIEVSDPNPDYFGIDDITLNNPLAPGASTELQDDVTIENQGAFAVSTSDVKVSCS